MTDLSSSSTPNDNTKSWIAHTAVYDVKLLWPFQTLRWGYIISFTCVKLTFPDICLWYLYVYISALVVPYIFLLVDHFKWALIGDIEQWRVHSVLWQFWWGVHCQFYPGKTDYFCISLYILISWLFQMGSHWWQCTVKSSLSTLAVSNGGFIVSFTWVNLKIWAHFKFCSCLTELFRFYKYKQKTNECFPIYLLGKCISGCWNCQNRAHFSKTIALRGHMHRFSWKMDVFPAMSLETP